MYVCVKERERERECVCVRERELRERESVCVCVCVYLVESNVQLGVFLGSGHDKLSTAVVQRKITDKDPTLIQILGAVHSAWEPRNGVSGNGIWGRTLTLESRERQYS